MKEKLKSFFRHILTAIGFLLATFGLGEYAGLIDMVSENLELIIAAVETIVGFVMMIYGFFKDKDRHEIVEQFRVAQLKKGG